MKLVDLPPGVSARVVTVSADTASDGIARRLGEIGFVEDEPVRVITCAPLGGDPVLVAIGTTRFALRRSEAARVTVQPMPGGYATP